MKFWLLICVSWSWSIWFPDRGHSRLEDQDRIFAPDQKASWSFTSGLEKPWNVPGFQMAHLGVAHRQKSWFAWSLLNDERLDSIWHQTQWGLGGQYHYHFLHALGAVKWLQYQSPLRQNFQWEVHLGLWTNLGDYFKSGLQICVINTCTPIEIALQWNMMKDSPMTINVRKHPEQFWELGIAQTLAISSNWTMRASYWYPARTLTISADFELSGHGVSAIHTQHPVLPSSKSIIYQGSLFSHD